MSKGKGTLTFITEKTRIRQSVFLSHILRIVHPYVVHADTKTHTHMYIQAHRCTYRLQHVRTLYIVCPVPECPVYESTELRTFKIRIIIRMRKKEERRGKRGMTRVWMRKKKSNSVFRDSREEKGREENGEGYQKIEEERIRKTKMEGKWGIEE